MAFCINCGTQLNEGGKFCSGCGAPTGGAGAPSGGFPSAAGGHSARTVTASPLSRAVKILLIVLSISVVLALAGVGSVLYIGHRAQKQAEQMTKAVSDPGALLGALQKDLPSGLPGLPPPAQSPAPPPPQGVAAALPNRHVTASDGQCALFTKEELTQVLGDTFTHADADATGCTYKGDAPRQWVRTEALWKGGGKLVKEKSDAYAGLRQSMASMHYTKAEIDSHLFPINPYPGAGDEAWVNLVNVVTARKGDVGITMDLRYYHDSDDLTRMLTNTALSRLGGNDSASAATPN